MPRSRKQRKKPIRSGRMPRTKSWIKWGILGALVMGVIIITLYIYIDRRVQKRLLSRTNDDIPAVYSEPLELTSSTRLSQESLKSELFDRRYREVSTMPTHPGEFQVIDATFHINTRAFQGPDGTTRDESQIAFAPTENTLKNKEGHEINSAFLEPQIISYLGSGELRASTHKSLKDIPKSLKNAVIAIEDERFYRHHGVDLIGISRAMLQNIKALGVVQGGSTITQQLAKNILFSPRKTLGRKIMEMLAAISLERHLSKDEILELYLNEVYVGQEGDIAIHGVGEAAKTFFGKKLEDITISESALLAGMIKAPSAYSPKRHLRRAMKRRDVVLEKMRELGFISDAELTRARNTKIQIIKKSLHPKTAAHFVTALTKEVGESLNADGVITPGISIYTGLNSNFQRCAETSLANGIQKLEERYPALKKRSRVESGLVAIEPFSGKVKAWVGGRDYSQNQFDHVNQAKRQVGSTIKAFLYLTALDGTLNTFKVATPLSILPDEPLKVNLVTKTTWMPEDYDHEYRGDVTLRFALEKSLNLPAAYIGQRVGIPSFARTLRRFRVGDNVPEVPALALGAVDTTLLSLTAAYGALANGGVYIAPRLYISAVINGEEPVAKSQILEERVADESAVYVLTNILQGVIQRGTGHAIRDLGFDAEAAGKTGTSNDARDAWFIGFTPDIVAGVWIGRDDNTPVGVTGGVAAAPIWAEFMKCIAPYHERLSFVPPRGVVLVDVDTETGQRATNDCPRDHVVREVFVEGTEPVVSCRIHRGDGGAIEPTRQIPEPIQEKRRKRSFWSSLFGE